MVRALLAVWFVLLSAGPVLAQSWPAPSPLEWRGCWAAGQCVTGSAAAMPEAFRAATGFDSCTLAPTTGRDRTLTCTCPTCPPQGVTYAAEFMGTCPSGASLVPATLECINDVCNGEAGSSRVFNLVQNGTTCAGAAPTHVCLPSGCRGAIISSSRMGFTNSGGSQACLMEGSAQVMTFPCQSGDTVVTYGISQINSPTQQPISAGGAGVQPTGTGATADSTNIARIATNTSRLVAAAEGGASGSWSGEEGAAAAAEAEALGVGVDAATAAVVAGLDAQKALIENAPDFGGLASRWIISLDAFLGDPGAVECSHTWDIVLPGNWPQQWTIDLCPWAPYFRAFMFWVLGILTAWSMWSTIYSHARRA